jgi:hypothetical protein
VQLARVPEFSRYPLGGAQAPGIVVSGLAAYGAMAEALLRDEDFDFPADDMRTMEMRCFAISNDGLHLLHWKRRAAISFLNAMAGDGGPASDDLRAAAQAYSEEIKVLEPSLRLAPHSFKPQKERLKLCDPGRRRTLAAIVREAKGHEESAVGRLEQALERLGPRRG